MNDTVYIDISEFDDKPGLFCMSYGFDINTFISSINKVGLINKPYIRRNKTGFIDIIMGYRRILALKALSWDKVPCVELTDSKLTDKELLILNLYDNLCTRRFNYIEKGMILDRLTMFFPREEVFKTYIDILGISSRKEADILLKMKDFNNEEKEVIKSESLSIKTMESLLELSLHSRMQILKYINNLKLNFNQQSLFIEFANGISTREGIEIQELLKDDNFADIMENGQNLPQKAKRFIDMLRARRMPTITKIEKDFSKKLSELNLPKNVRIKHSPFFEGTDYLLETFFKDGNELKKTIDELARIKGLSDIRDPWKEG